jgi:hypothetical protein
MSLRVFIAITTSSSAALPARSPMPLMVHSIWRRRPGRRPANWPPPCRGRRGNGRRNGLAGIRHAFAHHCDEREIFVGHRIADGVGMLMVVAPALIAASTQRQRKSCSVRVPSSLDHSTSSVLRAPRDRGE